MKRLIPFILLSTLLVMSACLPQGGSGVDDCSGQGLLFQDDFSGEQNCGWVTYSQGGAMAEVTEGVLQITTSQPGELRWTNPNLNFNDVIINVQARQVSGPNDNAYGVICRYQNEENFYIFLVSGDGFYAIGKYQSGVSTVEYLMPDNQFQFSDVINQGTAINQLRVSCIGNELSLSVNGIELYSTTDPTFVTGDIGVGASTLQLGTAVLQFDNMSILAP